MKKALIAVFLVGSAALPFAVLADHTTDHTIEQLKAQLESLQAQIKALGESRNDIKINPFPPTPSVLRSLPIPPKLPPMPTSPPISISIPRPIFDDNTSDDEVIQLNNLRITSISYGSFPAVITASTDYGVRCLKYMSPESAAGIAYPCPASPSYLYQIRIDTDTILLLRTRVRASLSQFAVGDRINIYGFMDPNFKTIDALVVRDLDKPEIQQFIQLNNIEMYGAPYNSMPPATFIVVQKIVSPCFDYGTSGTGGAAFPCPMGLETKERVLLVPQGALGSASGSAKVMSGTAVAEGGGSSMYYPYPKKYIIEVTTQTQIIDRTRTPISLAELAIGDTLNIYGAYNPSTATVRAYVIRDLSRPGNVLGSLQVTVTDGSECRYYNDPAIYPLPPCGILYNAVVQLYQNATFIGKKVTERGAVVFDGLNPGNYTLVVDAPGYERSKEPVTVSAGETQSVVIALIETSLKPISIETGSKLSGTVGKSLQEVFYGTGGQPSYSFSISAGSLPPGLELRSPPMPMIACIVDQPCPVWIQTSVWVQGIPTRAGSYKFTLTAKDQLGNTGSGTFVITINSGGPIQGLYIDPASLRIKKGGSATMRAYVNNCPDGAQCLVGPQLVNAAWSSADLAVVSISCPTVLAAPNAASSAISIGCSEPVIQGNRAGAAEIKAVYTDYGGMSSTAYAKVQVIDTDVSGLRISVTTDKGSYTQDEKIAMTIKAENPTASDKVLNFNTGCQVSYSVASFVYLPPCVQVLNSLTIPAYSLKTWYVTHEPSTYRIPVGEYKLTGRVMGYGEAVALIRITSGAVAAPMVSSLTPSSGPVGTTVTIRGIGFLPPENKNTVRFGAGTINYLNSFDGMTIQFTVPGELDVHCGGASEVCLGNPKTIPGNYGVAVMNANGTSNELTFAVTSR